MNWSGRDTPRICRH